MKLLYKRIFVMFSIALNIGFVIMAITMYYHHSRPFHERSWLEIVDIVHRLKMPEQQESTALETIKRFRIKVDGLEQNIKQTHINILNLLARTGQVDRDKLHCLVETSGHQERLKEEAFETHVLELCNLLGDEKGALFFSLLLDHIKAEKERPHS